MLLILTIATLLSFSGNAECNAATNTKKTPISINKKNFTDKAFRKYVKKKIDKNKDGKLSKKEISKVKRLNLYDTSLGIKEFKKFNCKGLEYFTNAKDLTIDSESGMKEGISNVKYLLKMKKLKYLHISGTFNKKKTLDLSPLKNLKTFDTSILNPKTLKLLEIDGTLVKKIDVTHLTNLEWLSTDIKTEVIKGDNQKFAHFVEEWDYYGYLKEIW